VVNDDWQIAVVALQIGSAVLHGMAVWIGEFRLDSVRRSISLSRQETGRHRVKSQGFKLRPRQLGFIGCLIAFSLALLA